MAPLMAMDEDEDTMALLGSGEEQGRRSSDSSSSGATAGSSVGAEGTGPRRLPSFVTTSLVLAAMVGTVFFSGPSLGRAERLAAKLVAPQDDLNFLSVRGASKDFVAFVEDGRAGAPLVREHKSMEGEAERWLVVRPFQAKGDDKGLVNVSVGEWVFSSPGEAAADKNGWVYIFTDKKSGYMPKWAVDWRLEEHRTEDDFKQAAGDDKEAY